MVSFPDDFRPPTTPSVSLSKWRPEVGWEREYCVHRSGERNKMAAMGYVNTQGDKLRTRSNAVLISHFLDLIGQYIQHTYITVTVSLVLLHLTVLIGLPPAYIRPSRP